MSSNPRPFLLPVASGRHKASRFALVAASVLAASAAVATRPVPAQETGTGAVRVAAVESLGVVTFATGTSFEGTTVGGWSGITWAGVAEGGDEHTYYAVCDDRSQINPARFYTLEIDVSDGALEPGDVTIRAVTTLLDEEGQAYAGGAIDPEGIAIRSDGTLLISSEGDARAGLAPSITEHGLDGRATGSLPVREHFQPATDGSRGVRNNLAFESLTIAPGGGTLYTASEAALVQDGPVPTVEDGSPARIAQYDLDTRLPGPEWIYPVAPIPVAPNPPEGFGDNGLPELIALDDQGTLLALERSFAVGVGNTIRLFETSTAGARDVSLLDALPPGEGGDPTALEGALVKRLVADLGELGIRPDNVEGMTFGPELADGRRLLILVSDNNFNAVQVTQVIALAVTLETVGGPDPEPTPSPSSATATATATVQPTAMPTATPRSLYLPRLLHDG